MADQDAMTKQDETVQHTPGPWHEGPTDGIGQRGKLIVVDAKGLKVADCEANRLGNGLTFRRPYAEDTANARLIAAAPDLLHVLKAALLQTGCDGDLCAYRWHEEARAAILKAEEGR